MLARLGFEPLHQVRGVTPGLALDLPHQKLARRLRGETGHPFEFPLLICHERVVFAGGRFEAPLALGHRRDPASELGFGTRRLVELFGERRLTAGEYLLDRSDLLPVIAGVLLGLEPQLVCAFFRVEQGFLAAGLRFTLRLA